MATQLLRTQSSQGHRADVLTVLHPVQDHCVQVAVHEFCPLDLMTQRLVLFLVLFGKRVRFVRLVAKL